MANRIGELHSKAVEIVEEKKLLTNQTESLLLEKEEIEELAAGLSDDGDISVLEEYAKLLDIEIVQKCDEMIENDENREEIISEVDVNIKTLEDNLSKIAQMKAVSDLKVVDTVSETEKKKISELIEIKKLLGEEQNISIDNEGKVETTNRINQIVEKTELERSSYDNSKDKQALICSVSQQWEESLTHDEYNAVRDYTKEVPVPYYKNINKKLRGQTLFFEDGNKQRADLIHSALQKASVPCDCTVYRGASIKQLGKYSNLSDEALVGKVILDKGFMSTSIIKGKEFGGEVKLEILVPAGSKGAYLGNGVSEAGEYECELLFDKGSKLKILEVYYDFSNRRVIKARMM